VSSWRLRPASQWGSMLSMAIDRRRFIEAAAAFGGTSLLGPALAAIGDDGFYVSGCRQADGSFAAVLFDARGRDLAVLPVETRLHDTAYSRAHERAVIFARRPGTLAFVIDLASRRLERTVVSPAGRHFYGHGVFSADGRVLYATENDFASGAGLIGLYDSTDGYRRIGEFPSGGIGPHELLLHPDGRSLIVANGGIRTNPETGREKLDLDMMASSLTRIDLQHGTITESVALPRELRLLSLRHLTVDATGAVWFGAQWEGDPGETPPIVGRYRPGSSLSTLMLPEPLARLSKGYVGSLASDAAGDLVATSCPKGGRIIVWEARTGKIAGVVALEDGCGVAPARERGFAMSSGGGSLIDWSPGGSTELASGDSRRSWDNHLRKIIGSE
jgi:uncharacterized protein